MHSLHLGATSGSAWSKGQDACTAPECVGVTLFKANHVDPGPSPFDAQSELLGYRLAAWTLA